MFEITVNSDEFNLKKWEQILPATYYDELVEMTKREWGEEYADYEYDAREVLDYLVKYEGGLSSGYQVRHMIECVYGIELH